MDFSLHALFAQAMDERLDLIKAVPQKILLADSDGGESRTLLAKRYPAAQIDTLISNPAFAAAEHAAWRKTRTWRQRLRGQSGALLQQTLQKPVAENAYDCIWANLSLPFEHTDSVLKIWANALRVNGMLFFTTFGVDTLREVRTLFPQYVSNNLSDMHDIGDEVLHCGFADPVTDMEKRTLGYRTPQRFWQDMTMLGLDTLLPADHQAQAQINQAILTGDLAQITLEIVYGHAIKPLKLPENETLVQFYRTKPTFE